jgi:glycosyltransferase involved in cell wall biosynthesis
VVVDFSQWAVLSHKDETGLGRIAADLRRVLKLGRHLVTPSERISGNPVLTADEMVFHRELSDAELRAAFDGLRGIILVERFWWHNRLLAVAREMGIFTVCAVNWEWFTADDPQWKLVDVLVCPTYYGLNLVQQYGYKNNAVYIPYGLDLSRYQSRAVTGPARLFVHNAGIVESDDRKGTGDTIRAFKKTRRDDIRLLVRVQNEAKLPKPDSRIEIQIGALADPADLYKIGDCAIQPSRMEGVGFMVLEALASGFPVVTTDYPPMNEYVRNPEMLVKTGWLKRKAFPTQWVKHAHLVLPDIADLARKIEWCATHDLSKASQENRAWSEARYSKKLQLMLWSGLVEALESGQLESYVMKCNASDNKILYRDENHT